MFRTKNLLVGLVCAGLASAQARPDACQVLVVVGLEDEARIAAGPGVRIVVSAGNADLLRERLRAIEPEGLAAVVSFGIAGGLDEELRVGDLLVAKRVVSGGKAWPVDPDLMHAFESGMAKAPGLQFREAVFLGMDQVTGIDREANRALRSRSGADLVDNESHVAAEFADRYGLPFAGIRTISDTADQDVPPAALLPLRPDGSGDWKAVLKSVLQEPSQLPDLVEIARGFFAALKTLRAVRERIELSELASCPAAVDSRTPLRFR